MQAAYLGSSIMQATCLGSSIMRATGLEQYNISDRSGGSSTVLATGVRSGKEDGKEI